MGAFRRFTTNHVCILPDLIKVTNHWKTRAVYTNQLKYPASSMHGLGGLNLVSMINTCTEPAFSWRGESGRGVAPMEKGRCWKTGISPPKETYLISGRGLSAFRPLKNWFYPILRNDLKPDRSRAPTQYNGSFYSFACSANRYCIDVRPWTRLLIAKCAISTPKLKHIPVPYTCHRSPQWWRSLY